MAIIQRWPLLRGCFVHKLIFGTWVPGQYITVGLYSGVPVNTVTVSPLQENRHRIVGFDDCKRSHSRNSQGLYTYDQAVPGKGVSIMMTATGLLHRFIPIQMNFTPSHLKFFSCVWLYIDDIFSFLGPTSRCTLTLVLCYQRV